MLTSAHKDLSRQIKVQLSKAQLLAVEALAEAAGVSVSAVIRECIEPRLADIWDSAKALREAASGRMA